MDTITQAVKHVLNPVSSPQKTATKPIWDESKKMKALVWHGKHDVRIEEHSRPQIVEPTDILIQITATTICGSDLHLYNHKIQDMHKGDILGHEFLGRVVEKGQAVKKLDLNDRVVVAFSISCGSCEFCKQDLTTLCDVTNPSNLQQFGYGHRTAAIYGYSHMLGGVPGGQSEFVRVPFADFNCFKVPDSVPDEKALFVSDVLCTSLHATELGEIKEGDTEKVVCIFGAGPIGLLAADWCRFKQVGKIILLDLEKSRLDLAEKHIPNIITGHVVGSNVGDKSVTDWIAQQVKGGPHVVIDATGFDYPVNLITKVQQAVGMETDSPDVVNQCLTCVRKGGHVVLIADYIGTTNGFMIGAMMEKHLTVRGGQCPVHRYAEKVLELLQNGKVDPTWIVSDRGTIDDIPRFYKLFDEKKILKTFIMAQTDVGKSA